MPSHRSTRNKPQHIGASVLTTMLAEPAIGTRLQAELIKIFKDQLIPSLKVMDLGKLRSAIDRIRQINKTADHETAPSPYRRD